ncbi:MAG: 16S rRNA (cytidine(1402)-2'-O)-methyltransferase [Eubacterium sp.]|nr:16S rRNA (cytidine(1402)-2'-O)-methyltransferase [Eubacterium sp.]
MEETNMGTLYLCATPIGNLEDMTYRVVRLLKEVDLIAAEDTRNSIKLLNHFEIKTPMTSYHEFNKIEKAHQLIQKLREGKDIALITDAGMPGISDPGEDLVRLCHEAGIDVSIAPGACACVSALALSGMPSRRFCFEAFLPKDKQLKKDIYEQLKTESRTIILYEAPHHLKKTLQELYDQLGNRKITLVKEITKRYENVFVTTFAEALDFYNRQEPRGEYVILIEGKSFAEQRDEERKNWEMMSLEEHMAHYENQGIARKDAMKLVAKDRGVSKRDVYNELVRRES